MNKPVKWKCSAYKNGKSTGGWTPVFASSEAEAERKALEKYAKKIKKNIDFVRCERALW